jgi:hypothetical protein
MHFLINKGVFMKQSNKSHKSDQSNSNKGMNGTNRVNAQVHGNRGAQLNPNQKGGKK